MGQPGQAECGAKNRAGKPCRAVAMANGRCRIHGGRSTGPKNPHSATHGIYSKFFTDEELAIELQLGSVDDELRLCKIRLHRAVSAQEEWDTAIETNDADTVDSFNELVEVEEQEGERPFGKDADTLPFSGKKKVRKRPNFEEIIYRMVQRIESLERTRKELGTNNDDDIRDAASKFRSAINEMDETVPPVDETKPDVGSTD